MPFFSSSLENRSSVGDLDTFTNVHAAICAVLLVIPRSSILFVLLVILRSSILLITLSNVFRLILLLVGIYLVGRFAKRSVNCRKSKYDDFGSR